jgi:hypothetical protein
MLHLDTTTKELILDEIMTLEKAIGFTNCLSIVASSLYQDRIREDVYKDSNVKDFYPLLNKLFKIEDLSNIHMDKMSENIQEIHSWIRDLTPVKYVISFSPTSDFIRTLYLWTKNNLDNQTIIEIEVNPEIVGGVTVSSKGKYKDFCLDKMLNDFFLTNRNAVISILQE